MPKTIFVGTTSKQKLAAVEQVMGEIYPEGKFEIKGVKADSQINKQPVGHEETLQGALNRLAETKELIGSTGFDLIITMENGIFPVKIGNNIHWFDFCWVIGEDNLGNQALAHSTGLEFNQDYVKEALRRGFDTTTVGSVISELTGTDSANPHSDLTNKLISRAEILRQSIKTVLGQLQKKNQTI